MTVDPRVLETLSHEFGHEIDQLEKKIFELAGESFNIDSRNQLAHVLFDKLQLPVVKRTKTGPSTD
ncbi:MAG: hypothetical protein GTO41_02835, partial [Burkholderiales bacterium]|nr:hypothetical protein [Burkholderiales bacterium]